ncbi:PTS sugar transporter subunit IIA [Reinekea forsetii]|nr:PTS sugar transporter subunit IIA [Reinekea forsetii]
MKPTLIIKETILLNMEASSKNEVIHAICGHLFLLKKTQDPAHLYLDIIEREEVVSTFAGSHTAIPHAITKHVDYPVLCFARIKNDDFTWNGSDEDVRFVILLCAPAQDDLRKLRQSQSYVFSSIAQLIGRTGTLDLWANAHDEQVILDSLNEAFEANLTTTI